VEIYECLDVEGDLDVIGEKVHGLVPEVVVAVNEHRNVAAAGVDAISLTASALKVTVAGLVPMVRILQPEVANERFIINGLGVTNIFAVGEGVTTNQ
jgi:hypothetical protein